MEPRFYPAVAGAVTQDLELLLARFRDVFDDSRIEGDLLIVDRVAGSEAAARACAKRLAEQAARIGITVEPVIVDDRRRNPRVG